MENSSKSINNQDKGLARLIGALSTGREGDQYLPGGENYCCAFAPDESRFAWSCGFRKVVLVPWNRYKNCLANEDDVKDGAGNIVTTEQVSIDCGFRVFSLALGTGTPVGDLFPVKRDYWTRFDYSKDLVLATGHCNGRVRIWDPYTGQLLLELTDHKSGLPVECVEFAPDGSLRLASGSQDGTVKIWDLSDDGNMLKTLREQIKYPIKGLSWSDNAKYLCSVGTKQKVLIWDMVDYKLSKRLVGHYNDVISSSFSPDGATLATCSNDTRIIIWDVEKGTVLRTLNHVNPPPGIIYMAGSNNFFVKGVSYAPNGCQIASVCFDGNLRLWDLMKEYDPEPQCIAKGITDDVMLACTFSPSGRAVAVSYASGCTEFYTAPPKVPSLRHCSRMAVRRAVRSMSGIDGTLPKTLVQYLQYREW